MLITHKYANNTLVHTRILIDWTSRRAAVYDELRVTLFDACMLHMFDFSHFENIFSDKIVGDSVYEGYLYQFM